MTNFPESYFGVMFSGRHDLKAMQCEDGSYFIDRDGTHFRYILNYLRNGEEMVESFSRLSADVITDLLCEAKFYQLDGLVKVLQCEIDVITQDNVMCHFSESREFLYSYYSREEIVFENKNMTGLSFAKIKFNEAVSFINCNLSNTVFHRCVFHSGVIFKNCLLSNTMFINVYEISRITYFDDSLSSGRESSSRSGSSEKSSDISFIHSNIERALFSCRLKEMIHSAGNI